MLHASASDIAKQSPAAQPHFLYMPFNIVQFDVPQLLRLTSLKSSAKPMTSGCGGRKFLVPRTMNDPIGRYSPEGADLDTCMAFTAHSGSYILPCTHKQPK